MSGIRILLTVLPSDTHRIICNSLKKIALFRSFFYCLYFLDVGDIIILVYFAVSTIVVLSGNHYLTTIQVIVEISVKIKQEKLFRKRIIFDLKRLAPLRFYIVQVLFQISIVFTIYITVSFWALIYVNLTTVNPYDYHSHIINGKNRLK